MAGKSSKKGNNDSPQCSKSNDVASEDFLNAELGLTMGGEDLNCFYGHEQLPNYDDLLQEVNIAQDDFSASARILDDGRVNINIDDNPRLSSLLSGHLRYGTSTERPTVPESEAHLLAEDGHVRFKPPALNIVIHVVGSRGDVQPFIALGRALKEAYNHRVRLATHAAFQSLVVENGLEFFNIGGDPATSMGFIFQNFRLMPSVGSIKRGDAGKRKREIFRIMKGCWRSCFEAGDGNTSEGEGCTGTDAARPRSMRGFVADAIIANPQSFSHVHCAQKLGIPLQLMLTMPWSPTQAFPHPLANIQPSKVDASVRNLVSYPMVEMMIWQGLGGTINAFRSKVLNLEPIRFMWGSQTINQLQIPYTYLWSPSLIPKPNDWGRHISVVGFPFLPISSSYIPDQELKTFLDVGPPPVYIGFGSYIVEDPPALVSLVFDAVRLAGQRALVSSGCGSLIFDSVPDGVFIVGDVPHDWLFRRVSCVVHHGEADITATGIRFGKPTVAVPFFGDQFFWGDMISRAGSGPKPIPFRELTPMKLAVAIQAALGLRIQDRARGLGQRIANEDGAKSATISFHKQINVDNLRCSLDPSRPAVWRVRRTNVILSAVSATVLIDAAILRFNDLKLYRHREYVLENGPPDPLTGAAVAVLDMVSNMTMGIADMPVEVVRSMRSKSDQQSSDKSDPRNEISRNKSNSAQSLAETYAPQSNDNFLAGEFLQSRVSAQDSASSTAQEFSIPRKLNGSSGYIRDDEFPILESELNHSPNSGTMGEPSFNDHRSRTNSVVQVSGAAAYGSSKGLGRIMLAGFRSPFEVSLSVAKGFHNVPRLWGDETVRQPDRITGAWSGIKAAGKGLSLGVYDGVTGLVTQPIDGARQEGAMGFAKGLGKGFGGVMMKPVAGSWGVLGYTYDGIDKEVQKWFGSNIDNHIIASRKAEGFEQVKYLSIEERKEITEMWFSVEVQTLKKKRKDKNHVVVNNSGQDAEKLSE